MPDPIGNLPESNLEMFLSKFFIKSIDGTWGPLRNFQKLGGLVRLTEFINWFNFGICFKSMVPAKFKQPSPKNFFYNHMVESVLLPQIQNSDAGLSFPV